VTEFAARPPLHEAGTFVGIPTNRVRTSRWRKGHTTFGPLGRLGVTAALLLMLGWGLMASGGPTPFGLWFFLGWSILAGIVLRQTWAPIRVDEPRRGPRAWAASGFPKAGADLQPSVALAIVAAPVLGALAFGWVAGDSVMRFGIVLILVMAGVVSVLIRLSDL
jgi:hypothetical protein